MKTFEEQLRLFSDEADEIVPNIKRGIEKESLRITSDGHLSKQDHPKSLGSALTHPSITTDYSEALIELVTPIFATSEEAIECLFELHQVVYHRCPDELLWVNSLPCLLGKESDILIAKFGTSNIGRMKHVYRRGLELRYGRKMQTIAGIHYNISMPESFWENRASSNSNLKEVASCGYMAGIRNFHRYCWLYFYLFGASPAACKSFFDDAPIANLSTFGSHTLYGPYATSLRMSNIGYRNPVQSEIKIDQNSMEGYIKSLCKVTNTPFAKYLQFGVKVDGDYVQLNHNLLQIENEYYSVIRPKRSILPLEKPTHALKERGIEYLELRCLDLDPFAPVGLSIDQAKFLEVFIAYCLLSPSSYFTNENLDIIAKNKDTVVLDGRRPNQSLIRNSKEVKLTEWGTELLLKMELVAEVFDAVNNGNDYQQAIQRQKEVIKNSELTPSARILEELKDNDEPFFSFAMRRAREVRKEFDSSPLSEVVVHHYDELASQSLAKQQMMEQEESVGFDKFLENYFAQ